MTLLCRHLVQIVVVLLTKQENHFSYAINPLHHSPHNHSRQREQNASPESIHDDRRESPVFQQGVTGGFVDAVNNQA